MKNILYVFNSLQFSGAEMMYIQAAPVFREYGCNLYAISTFQDPGNCVDEFKSKGFIVDQIVINNTRKIKEFINFCLRLKRFIEINEINILHCQATRLFFICALVSRICGIQCVYSVNNIFTCSARWKIPIRRFQRYITRRVLKCRFHSGSDTVYYHELNYYKNKTEIVYWWYDDNDYYPAKTGEKVLFREELGLLQDDFILITAGSCNYQKNHKEIIKAARIIKDSIPNFKVLHLGKGETEEEEILLANELGLSDCVLFRGNQSQFRKYLIASDVFCMTSRFEGLSNATIDALACGIPAVLYHVPGLWDYNINGDNTIQVDSLPEELAKGVIHLYNDERIREQYVNKGYTLVTRKYRASTNIKQLYDTFYA